MDEDDNGKFRLERVNTCYEYNINEIVSHQILYLHFVLLAYQNTVSGNEMCVFQDLQMFGFKLNKYE